MLQTVRRFSIVTSLIIGIFLSGSAWAATATSIGLAGNFGYDGDSKTLTFTDVAVDLSSFPDLLAVGDRVTLTAVLGSGNTMSLTFESSTVIEAAQDGDLDYDDFDYADFGIIELYPEYTITGGEWDNLFQTDFYLNIALETVGGSTPFSFDQDYSGTAEIEIVLTSVPAPSSLLLIGFGLMLFAGYRRKIDI